jgi:hypothetical protein
MHILKKKRLIVGCCDHKKVDGCWKLIYSTISILGKRRTKLGLRDFISLGDFFQIIDVKEVSQRP